MTQISRQQRKTIWNSCTWSFHVDIKVCKVVPLTLLSKAAQQFQEEKVTHLSDTEVYKCWFYVAVGSDGMCSSIISLQDLKQENSALQRATSPTPGKSLSADQHLIHARSVGFIKSVCCEICFFQVVIQRTAAAAVSERRDGAKKAPRVQVCTVHSSAPL